MKLFLKPRDSPSHRVACIALYRALLGQCPRAQHLAEGWPATPLTIKHLVRKQFRRNKHVESKRLVAAALEAGYEAEEMLRKAGDGDVTAKSQVMAVLHEVESQRALSRTNAAPHLKPPKRRLPAPYPGAKPALEIRPRPKEELGSSGLRKVPQYINASGYPMLRFSKHHSPFLARVIKDKSKQEQKVFDRVNAHDQLLKFARREDNWDAIIEEAMRKEGLSRGLSEIRESSWSGVVYEQKKQDQSWLHRNQEKNNQMARDMLSLVSREEELMERERAQRKRAKKVEKMEMKRDGGGERGQEKQ